MTTLNEPGVTLPLARHLFAGTATDFASATAPATATVDRVRKRIRVREKEWWRGKRANVQRSNVLTL